MVVEKKNVIYWYFLVKKNWQFYFLWYYEKLVNFLEDRPGKKNKKKDARSHVYVKPIYLAVSSWQIQLRLDYVFEIKIIKKKCLFPSPPSSERLLIWLHRNLLE